MRVKLSSDAKHDIRQQIDYLQTRTNSGLVTFRNIIARATRLLGEHPRAGQTSAQLPIRGTMRIIVDGWYFDYDVIDNIILIQRITSSVNTPMLTYDDDFNYEDDRSASDEK